MTAPEIICMCLAVSDNPCVCPPGPPRALSSRCRHTRSGGPRFPPSLRTSHPPSPVFHREHRRPAIHRRPPHPSTAAQGSTCSCASRSCHRCCLASSTSPSAMKSGHPFWHLLPKAVASVQPALAVQLTYANPVCSPTRPSRTNRCDHKHSCGQPVRRCRA